MANVAVTSADTPRRLRFDWVSVVLFRPRKAFESISSAHTAVWLTPMLILTLCTLIQVFVSGPVKATAAAMGTSPTPEFQYYTPEQQAQLQQALAATSGPVFVYVFPALSALVKVWVGWLLVGGLLHLVLTLLGGRGDTGAAMNLVAWASLPLSLRELVRAGAVLSTHQLISKPGLSGFAPVGESTGILFLTALLGLIDIYLLWHILLIVIGARVRNELPTSKVLGGVLITILIVLSVQALTGSLIGKLGSLTIIRPFF